MSKKIISIFTALIFATLAISYFKIDKNNRSVASMQESEDFASLINDPSKMADLKIIVKNYGKLILEATYQNPSEKISIANDALRYLDTALPILSLPEFERKKYLLSPPAWSSEFNREFLNDFTLENSKFYKKNISLRLLYEYQRISLPFLSSFSMIPKLNPDIEMTDEVKLKQITLLETKINEQLTSLWKDDLWKFRDIKLNNKMYDDLIKEFFAYYFQKIDRVIIRNIISDGIDLGRQPTNSEILQLFFKNSGPAMGKVLQQLAKEPGLSESIEKIMEPIESKGKEVPPKLIKNIIQQESQNFDFISFEERPLGTGTVAQVNMATLRYENKPREVALRFLKPGIDERIHKDITMFPEFLQYLSETGKYSELELESYKKLLRGVEIVLLDELDILGTIKKQEMAESVYTKSYHYPINNKESGLVEFHVPHVFRAKTEETQVIVQDLVRDGTKFSKMSSLKGQELTARYLLQNWTEELILGSGFFHADLHEGNFKALFLEEQDRLHIYLFDFGMVEQLNKKEQRGLLLMTVGTLLKEKNLIATGLFQFTEKTEGFKEFQKSVEELSKANPKYIQEDWLMWAFKNGHVNSEKFGVLARASKLMTQPAGKVGRASIQKKIVLEMARKYGMGLVFDTKGRYPVTKLDIFKIGSRAIKLSCDRAMRAFMNLFN